MANIKVTVLMSTYNGHKYIKEQLDSLLRQTGVELRIIIRDDGSKDDTINILADYESTHSNIIIIRDVNCGAEESFNKLCKYALNQEPTDYYAFCDQDDVWEDDKLKVAVRKLQKLNSSRPNLYFSNLKMVDENLSYMREFYQNGEVFTDKNKTLVQIFTYGCTCVFNHRALEAYCKIAHNQVLHDNWIYALCSYLGNVVYDPIGHILYRQHGNNLSGHKETGISLIKLRLGRAFKGNLGHDFETMAKQLLFYRNEIEHQDLKLINHVAFYRKKMLSKLFLLCSLKFRTGNLFKDLCIKYRVMLNSL